jgi:hypothetical protein
MPESAPPLDPSTRAALAKLADVVAPAPVSFVPQTWGWAGLAIAVLALAVWGLARWRAWRAANRYRVQALDELAQIEGRLSRGETAAALAALPPLIKRAALAAWPRARVASLSQARWIAFLGQSESAAAVQSEIAAPLSALLSEREYLPPEALAETSVEDAHACTRAARKWIETHRVST